MLAMLFRCYATSHAAADYCRRLPYRRHCRRHFDFFDHIAMLLLAMPIAIDTPRFDAAFHYRHGLLPLPTLFITLIAAMIFRYYIDIFRFSLSQQLFAHDSEVIHARYAGVSP